MVSFAQLSNDQDAIRVTQAEYDEIMRKHAAGLLPTYYVIKGIENKIGMLDSFTNQQSPRLFYATQKQAEDVVKVINQAYAQLSTNTYQTLLFQTRLKPYLNQIRLALNEQGDLGLDFSRVLSTFEAVHAENPEKAFVDLGEFIAYGQRHQAKEGFDDLSLLFAQYRDEAQQHGTLELYNEILGLDIAKRFEHQNGTAANDHVRGNEFANYLFGLQGDDSLYGGDGHDQIEGNDVLYGGIGNDRLMGSAGNDYLEGGYGNDTFIFQKGDGQDVIHDYSDKNNHDAIQFKDVNFEEIQFGRKGDDLTIQNKNNDDAITVQNFFYRDEYKIENFDFADYHLALAKVREQSGDSHHADIILQTMNHLANSYKNEHLEEQVLENTPIERLVEPLESTETVINKSSESTVEIVKEFSEEILPNHQVNIEKEANQSIGLSADLVAQQTNHLIVAMATMTSSSESTTVSYELEKLPTLTLPSL